MHIDEKRNEFDIRCDCGCSTIEIVQWFGKNGIPENVWISHKVRSFDAYYHSGWERFKEKIKLIWYVILGKEYHFYEITLGTKQQIIDFKNAVAKLDENIEEYN